MTDVPVSVINWSPEPGALVFYRRFKEIKKELLYFIKLVIYYVSQLFDNIFFFSGHKNVQVGSGSEFG